MFVRHVHKVADLDLLIGQIRSLYPKDINALAFMTYDNSKMFESKLTWMLYMVLMNWTGYSGL